MRMPQQQEEDRLLSSYSLYFFYPPATDIKKLAPTWCMFIAPRCKTGKESPVRANKFV